MRRFCVIVCTRNRCKQLSEALRSFETCRVPDGWEADLIIVDNGSTDATSAVASEMPRRGQFAVRVIAEMRPGLSCARNAGLRATDAELVAFTDDDCKADPDWVSRLIETFDNHPSVSALFGRVQPPEGAKASHMVAVKTEESAHEYRYPAMPGRLGHGNNMAFRRQALAQVGAFDEALGAGAPLAAAEDLDMAYRILRRGGVIRYEPSCRIVHAPRESKAQVNATHWRNAVGMGACYGKHALRGDAFAWKCLFWLLIDIPVSSMREWRSGRSADLYTKWLYFWGLPIGIFKRAAYDLFHPSRLAAQGSTCRS